MWINGGRQRFPSIGRRTDENGPWVIPLNLSIQLPDSEFQIRELNKSEPDNCRVDHTCNDQSLFPLFALELTLPLLAPRLWKKVQRSRSGRRLDRYQFRRRCYRALDAL